MSDLLKILLAVALIGINGFFVAAEFAMIRVRRTRVEELAEQGQAASKAVLRILERLDIFLAATQLGITIVTLGLGAFAEPVMQQLLRPAFGYFHVFSARATSTIAYIVGLVIITVTEVIFGELIPKWSVLKNPERSANVVVYPMNLFVRMFYPLILFLKWFASVFAKLIGINPAAVGMVEAGYTEEEIIAIVDQAKQQRTIGSSEAEIVDNVFEFAHTQAHEIMVPRVDIVALSTELPLKQNIEIASASGYTRFPLCVEDRDHIVGMVHIKDLIGLEQQASAGAQPVDIRSIVRDMPAVPETKRIDDLLREMQRSHSHMAIVLDEYGGTAGLVTMEDIIEELVGEIQDEYDRPAPVEHLPDGRIAIAGAEPLDTVTEETGLTLENDEDYQTLGGYARHVLGLEPKPGACAPLGEWTITVAEAQAQRISRLIFAPAPSDGADHAEARNGVPLDELTETELAAPDAPGTPEPAK